MSATVKIIYSKKIPARSVRMTYKQFASIGLIPRTGGMVMKFASLRIRIDNCIPVDDDRKSDELCFSDDLRCQMHLPENSRLQIKVIGNGRFELGPVIGVLISSKKIANIVNGKWDSVYEHMSSACKSLNGLCCLFSIGDIDWENKLIRALLLKGIKWEASVMPIPTVIYDRCFGGNSRDISLEIRKKLGNRFHIVNAMPKLRKWETYTTLRKSPDLDTLMSPTTLYHNFKDVADALEKYPSVYMKPDALYKGKGIFRVSHGPDSNYIVECRGKNENMVEYLASLEVLESLLGKYMKAGSNYIVQAAINKASFRGYPFDFRLLYQKNHTGTWEPGGIAVRMGAPGSIITSPRSGGAVEELPLVLREEFGEEPGTKDGLYDNILRIGKDVAVCIEKDFGDCVELGLDMTIDAERRIWVIEVNGKPLKVSLKWLNLPEMLTRCYRRPIEYCIHLTGFESNDTGCGGL